MYHDSLIEFFSHCSEKVEILISITALSASSTVTAGLSVWCSLEFTNRERSVSIAEGTYRTGQAGFGGTCRSFCRSPAPAGLLRAMSWQLLKVPKETPAPCGTRPAQKHCLGATGSQFVPRAPAPGAGLEVARSSNTLTNPTVPL